MTFVWPQALLALLLVPLGLAAYRAIDRRQRRKVAVFGRSGLFGQTDPSGSTVVVGERVAVSTRIRRSSPGVLVAAGLIVMVIALARPQGTVDVPRQEGTVILAFDISASMGATDIEPTRMAAAVAAATAFVRQQPASVVVGVVAFSDSGVSVQQPTNDQEAVVAALGRLQPQRGTSLARGIDASLAAIERVAAGPTVDYYSNRSPEPTPSPTPVPPGTHAPAVIVLLSDGENTQGPDPVQAAQAAADRGVRIYTVGIGSEGGATLDLDGFQVHTQLDASTLRAIADRTDGTYYGADDAATLEAIYGQIDTAFVVRPEEIELTGLFAAVGLGFLFAGAVISLATAGRLP
jgi:Ca-activated chloride channel family protein